MAKKKEYEYPETIAGYPSTTRKKWLQAQNTNSRKNAIRAMCLLCLGGSPKEVAECSSPTCQLFKYRITG